MSTFYDCPLIGPYIQRIDNLARPFAGMVWISIGISIIAGAVFVFRFRMELTDEKTGGSYIESHPGFAAYAIVKLVLGGIFGLCVMGYGLSRL